MTMLIDHPVRRRPRFVSRWLGNISGSAVMWAHALGLRRPDRVQKFRAHVHTRPRQRSGRARLAWWIRLFTKALDVIAFGETYNLLGQILKPTTRTLTPTELTEARRVFHTAIPLDHVRIDEYSLLAWLGAIFRLAQIGKLKHLGVVIAYTINFTRPIHAEPGNDDMAWLIHELVHVAQMEQVGLQYYPEAIYAQFIGGYDYDPAQLNHQRFCEFNREQQGEIVRDYYRHFCQNLPSHAPNACIAELRLGLV